MTELAFNDLTFLCPCSNTVQGSPTMRYLGRRFLAVFNPEAPDQVLGFYQSRSAKDDKGRPRWMAFRAVNIEETRASRNLTLKSNKNQDPIITKIECLLTENQDAFPSGIDVKDDHINLLLENNALPPAILDQRTLLAKDLTRKINIGFIHPQLPDGSKSSHPVMHCKNRDVVLAEITVADQKPEIQPFYFSETLGKWVPFQSIGVTEAGSNRTLFVPVKGSSFEDLYVSQTNKQASNLLAENDLVMAGRGCGVETSIAVINQIIEQQRATEQSPRQPFPNVIEALRPVPGQGAQYHPENRSREGHGEV